MDQYIMKLQDAFKRQKLTGAAAALNGVAADSALLDASLEALPNGTVSITAENAEGRLFFGGAFSLGEPNKATEAAQSFARWTRNE